MLVYLKERQFKKYEMTRRVFRQVKKNSQKLGNGHSQVVTLFQLTKKLAKHNCFMNLNFRSAKQ